MAKAFCLFMSMDKMMGGKFEKSLAELNDWLRLALQFNPRAKSSKKKSTPPSPTRAPKQSR